MKKNIIIVLVLIVVVIGVYVFVLSNNVSKAKINEFATCINEIGAKFYGAFWCSHCQAQKRLFNNSSSLPYVECSTEDGQGQTGDCVLAKIEAYPTWKFSSGQVKTGELSFNELAELTGCETLN